MFIGSRRPPPPPISRPKKDYKTLFIKDYVLARASAIKTPSISVSELVAEAESAWFEINNLQSGKSKKGNK